MSAKIPSYCHHKGSGQAFVQVKGRRHYLGKWNLPESKERYARFVAELAVSPAATKACPPWKGCEVTQFADRPDPASQ